jgi:hypothetical protein
LNLDRTRTALRRQAGLLLFELICGVVTALLVGSFLAGHIHEVRFAVPALVLHSAVLFTIVASVRQLAWLGQIDYAAPVVAIQHDLARLRASRLRTTRFLLLLSPLLWTPFAIVAAQGLFGFDLYRGFGPGWIVANLALGVAVIPLTVWLTHRYAEQLGRSPWMERLADDIAGRSLATAKGHLDEIARFEEQG